MVNSINTVGSKFYESNLFRLRPSVDHFPIVVSQDGDKGSVAEAISSFLSEDNKISFIHVSLHLLHSQWNFFARFID